MTLEEFSKMLYCDYKSIERINEIVNKHCIDWHTIAETLEEAIPLIDEMGPDGILYTIIREKIIRGLNDGTT